MTTKKIDDVKPGEEVLIDGEWQRINIVLPLCRVQLGYGPGRSFELPAGGTVEVREEWRPIVGATFVHDNEKIEKLSKVGTMIKEVKEDGLWFYTGRTWQYVSGNGYLAVSGDLNFSSAAKFLWKIVYLP